MHPEGEVGVTTRRRADLAEAYDGTVTARPRNEGELPITVGLPVDPSAP
ncbi:hypothetical protein [Nonomuraea turkmeniaca]|nr:hypothetical protein [Nonomuraea turkmeniaca]